tara:strand:+ start:994 stop:1221 length:228 start_codon:yes stop_codon:yes gene_type:complete
MSKDEIKQRDSIDLLPNPETLEEFNLIQENITSNTMFNAGVGWTMGIALYQRLERNLGRSLNSYCETVELKERER